MIAEELVKNGRVDRCRTVLRTSCSPEAPAEPIYQIRLGVAHFRSRAYGKADETFRSALVRFRTVRCFTICLVTLPAPEGLYDEAAKAFNRSLELQPKQRRGRRQSWFHCSRAVVRTLKRRLCCVGPSPWSRKTIRRTTTWDVCWCD